jgi:hypothetical protein
MKAARAISPIYKALSDILFNETAQRFLRADNPHFPAEDPILCLQRDVYDFALRVERVKQLVWVKKTII